MERLPSILELRSWTSGVILERRHGLYHGPAVSIVWIRTVYGHANTVEIISRRSFSPLALCARQPVTARNENMFFALAWSCCPANATESQIRPGSPLDGWSTHEVWHVHVDCVGGIEMA